MRWTSEGVSGVWTGHSGEQTPCHCEEQSGAAISIAERNAMEIASLRSQ